MKVAHIFLVALLSLGTANFLFATEINNRCLVCMRGGVDKTSTNRQYIINKISKIKPHLTKISILLTRTRQKGVD